MSEERKSKRDKLTDSPIIFTENDHFSGEIESGEDNYVPISRQN